MVVWNYLAVLFLVVFGVKNTNLSSSVHDPVDPVVPKRYIEIPTLNVNVYMMGRDYMDEEASVHIQQNIDFINAEFEGYIRFNFDQLFMDSEKAFLPDLYKSFQENETEGINKLVGHSEIKGGVNIFIFDTYCEEGTDQALMGFTPSLRAQQEHYEVSSPEFDRIYMAYDGLADKTTMIHEMGHFLGLHHPWEMTVGNRHSLGMKNEHDVKCNHMSYGPEVEKFTTEQLESMRLFALQYRKYLMEKIVYVSANRI